MGIVQQIKRGLDQRRVREADIEYGISVRPEGSTGLHVVRDEHDDTERVVGSSLSGQTFKPGAVVPLGSHTGFPGQFIIGAPPPGRRGASGFAIDAPTPGDLEVLSVVSAEPSTVESGASSAAVTVTGMGFRAGDIFEAVVFDNNTGEWSVDPLVTVDSSTVTTTETADLTISVSSSAPEDYLISIQARR